MQYLIKLCVIHDFGYVWCCKSGDQPDVAGSLALHLVNLWRGTQIDHVSRTSSNIMFLSISHESYERIIMKVFNRFIQAIILQSNPSQRLAQTPNMQFVNAPLYMRWPLGIPRRRILSLICSADVSSIGIYDFLFSIASCRLALIMCTINLFVGV